MIINFSRASQFEECEWKAWIRDGLGLVPHKTADPLLTGGAYHHGAAVLLSTGDVIRAHETAEAYVRDAIKGVNYLPEELIPIEQGIEFAKRALTEYAKVYPQSDYKLLMPEVEFLVPLAGTEHHCFYVHKLLHPQDPSTPFYIDEVGCDNPKCIQPHYIRGTTDGLIEMNNMIWLLEQKTTSITGDIFYKRWALDMQPTIYMYGIWKKTGIRPHGFVLNIIKKPNKRAADQLNVQIEREAFLRSDDDLKRAAEDIATIATKYEDVISGRRRAAHTGAFHGACLKWNRECYYHERCKRGDHDIEGEFTKRQPDYVDKAYYDLLGLAEPAIA
jgi:hypothetical protein